MKAPMMKLLVKLTLANGSAVLVNPRHIISAVGNDKDSRLVIMDNGESFQVQETLNQIMEEVTYENRLDT